MIKGSHSVCRLVTSGVLQAFFTGPVHFNVFHGDPEEMLESSLIKCADGSKLTGLADPEQGFGEMTDPNPSK